MRLSALCLFGQLVFCAAVGCGSPRTAPSQPDAGHAAETGGAASPDGGTRDAAQPDAAQLHDGGLDAGAEPAPPHDASAGDAAASDAGNTADDDASVSAPPAADAAPPGPEPLRDCQPPTIDFTLTRPRAAGTIAITFSAWLTPLGVNERVYVDVLNDQGDPDLGYSGNLLWALPDGCEIVSATTLMAGQAEVTFRFQREGLQQVEASLADDPRSGSAETQVYTTQLPVWSLQVNTSDFERIVSDPESREQIVGTLQIDAAQHPAMLRMHGGSSRYVPKKSFRIELSDTGPVSDGYGKKLVLRAEYNDKTLLRNWLALRMFSVATHIPTPRSKLVHFRVNDRYYGVMLNVERVDSRLLDRWGLARTGSMYEADPIDALASPGANLTPLAPDQYPDVYPRQNGTIDYTDLRKLIEDTLTRTPDEFARTIEAELVVDEYVSYLAMMAAIQNVDHVRKNYYLYRDPAGSVGWRVIPWDLDLTFGHLWTEENETLDENIFSDVDIYMGEEVTEQSMFYNRLIDRVLKRDDYRARFRARLGEFLSTGAVTRATAEAWLQSALRCATPDIVADPQKRATNAEYLDRVAEIGEFLDARKAYVEAQP